MFHFDGQGHLASAGSFLERREILRLCQKLENISYHRAACWECPFRKNKKKKERERRGR